MSNTEWLRQLADNLDKAKRDGSAEDKPEGNRYIILSDTLARMISEKLRKISLDYSGLEAAEFESRPGGWHG